MNNTDKRYAVIGQRYLMTQRRTENKDMLSPMLKFADTEEEAEEYVQAFISRYDMSIVWLQVVDMKKGLIIKISFSKQQPQRETNR